MKKLLTLVLALAMALSMMSFAVADEEPFVLTVMLPDFYSTEDFITENNPVLDYIEQETGVRLDISFVANSTYGDAVTTALTDSKMPMVIALPDRNSAQTVASQPHTEADPAPAEDLPEL